MCGLVGMMGALDTKHRDVMKDLLYFDTLRGQDSTGVAAVDRNRKVQLRKLTVPGYDFINMGFINNLMCFGDQLWLGHNRFKTRGSVTRTNAHPFEVTDDEGYINVIGAHNGTLDNQFEIEAALGNNKRFGTDSEALINLIESVGPKEAISKARGAWSLVWWDAVANRLCFLRNDKRPMFYAYTKDRKVLIWASEVWMILAACNRHGLDLEFSEGGVACYKTSEDTLYSFDIPQDKSEIKAPTKEGGLLGAPEKAPFRGAGGYGYGSSLWDGIDDEDDKLWVATGGNNSGKPQSKATTPTPKADETTPKAGNVVTLGRLKGFGAKWITPAERDEIANAGCGWCGDKLDKTKMAYVSENEAVCIDCTKGKKPINLDPPRKILTAKKG